MSRREIDSTDDSEAVMTSLAENARIASMYLLQTPEEIELDPVTAVLGKTLSIRTPISNASSFSHSYQQARSGPQNFVQIGEGLQGAIFEQVGKSLVIKKESPVNESTTSRLSKEYEIHTQISLGFQRFARRVQSEVFVPRPVTLISSLNRPFWDENLGKLPECYRRPTTVMKMERILPMPKVVRQALISYFHPRPHGLSIDRTILEQVLSSQPNKHCLVRVYLGKKTCNFSADSFSLRNFPLCLDAMKELGLDIEALSNSMGKAYAIIHWGAGYNGYDVEFVLGTVMSKTRGKRRFRKRVVRLCLLDFGQCDSVDMDKDPERVYMSFYGAMVLGYNQWFIPHCRRDPDIFKPFRAGYVDAGNIILREKSWVSKFDMEEFMNGYERYAKIFLAQ